MSVWVVMLDIISEEMVVPQSDIIVSRYNSGSNNTFLGYRAGRGGQNSVPYSSGQYNVAFGAEDVDDSVLVGNVALVEK